MCVYYAYCMMLSHVHRWLRGSRLWGWGDSLATRATRRRNKLEGRSDTLWGSRYKSSPVQTDRYWLTCCRYIELNPVRASVWGLRWMGEWIDRDPNYLGLGATEAERRRQYSCIIHEAIPDRELSLIRQALQRGQLIGNDRFLLMRLRRFQATE